MERFNKKFIIFSTLIAILLIILIPTVYKIVKDYHEDSYKVVEKKALEAAQKCWNEKVCLKNTITLKELYDNAYLDVLINPISKKIYNENSTIKKNNEKYVIDLY